MRACGIVAEFNPLHNGHIYLMEEARRLSGDNAVVVAMSGDYVQRGEPAIYDKWSRTGAALRHGADLVVEIPVAFALGNARQYARAGVRILEALGCTDHLAFGSESGNVEALQQLAKLIKKNKADIDELISAYSEDGISYPAAREKAVSELIERSGKDTGIGIEEALHILRNPNDILALEYIMSLHSTSPICVKREGAGYDDPFDESKEFQSASGIRRLLRSGESAGDSDKGRLSLGNLESFLPVSTADIIKNEKISSDRHWSRILRYAVLSSTADEIDNCPSGGEGLGNLLIKAAHNNDTRVDMIRSCKSKRYTHSRISRLCMQLMLGVKRRMPDADPAYIRVLGFTGKGRELLAHIKENETNSLPVITNINKESGSLSSEGKELLRLDIHAGDIYNLVSDRDVGRLSDHRMMPVIIDR